MKAAIFPGSFDPIHLGHLALAQTAADQLELDQVWFVPSGVSPNKRHKQKTPGATRFKWIELALQDLGDERLRVSDVESRHTVTTYTEQTVEQFKRDLPTAELFLLVGADTAQRMQRWPSYNRILKMAELVSFGRDGMPGTIFAPEWPHASSDIKRRIWLGQDISGLVPRTIAKQITQNFKTHGPV